MEESLIRVSSKMQAVHSPRMSQEFYDKLMQTFKQIDIKPSTTMQDIQFNAGQQAVLKWVQFQLTGKYNVQYVEDVSKPSVVTRIGLFFRRVYDKIRNCC